METSGVCKGCKRRTLLVEDADTGKLVCSSCGHVQNRDNFQAHIGGISGPSGTNVGLGTVGSGTVYSYKQTKVYDAQKIIQDIMFKLGLESTFNEVKAMVETVTEGEYGSGRWFPIFVGACAYVVTRKDVTRKNKKALLSVLSVVEVADLVGCDCSELGRMINRVVDFLDLKLPEFDIVNSFQRAVRNSPSLKGLSEDLIGTMLKQGVFLIQCSMKWYLTTGRRPMPIVAAILVFVAQLNQVRSVKMEAVVKELHVALSTSKKRYNELLEKLVKVAKVALPWGKDVTVKNIMNNAPSVMQYMELKASSSSNGKEKKSSLEDDVGFDMEDLVSDSLKTERAMISSVDEHELQYFDVKNPSNMITDLRQDELLQISPMSMSTSLAMIHSKLLDEVSTVESSSAPKPKRRKDDWRTTLTWNREWWTGKSEMSKKLLLNQIVEKNVGFDADPPSFDKGKLAYQKRKEKIKAAKLRIQKTMHPYPSEPAPAPPDDEEVGISSCGKKRKRVNGGMDLDWDWEDSIIETLLLHQVKEEEIEKGHYKVLLDLHVFHHLV